MKFSSILPASYSSPPQLYVVLNVESESNHMASFLVDIF